MTCGDGCGSRSAELIAAILTVSGLALGGLLAGGLWRAPAALPAPPAAGWDTAAYWAFIDRVQARMDALWNERAGRLLAGPVDGAGQHAAHARRRRAGRAPGPGAARRSRRADRRPALPPAVVRGDERARRRPAARAGVARRLRPASRDRRAGGVRADGGVAGPRRARPAGRALGADGRLHRAHDARPLLALPDDPAQPDRLVLPHVHAAPSPSAARATCSPTSCARCAASSTRPSGRVAGATCPTSGPATASTTCRAPRRATATTSTRPSTGASRSASCTPTPTRARSAWDRSTRGGPTSCAPGRRGSCAATGRTRAI